MNLDKGAGVNMKTVEEMGKNAQIIVDALNAASEHGWQGTWAFNHYTELNPCICISFTPTFANEQEVIQRALGRKDVYSLLFKLDWYVQNASCPGLDCGEFYLKKLFTGTSFNKRKFIFTKVRKLSSKKVGQMLNQIMSEAEKICQTMDVSSGYDEIFSAAAPIDCGIYSRVYSSKRKMSAYMPSGREVIAYPVDEHLHHSEGAYNVELKSLTESDMLAVSAFIFLRDIENADMSVLQRDLLIAAKALSLIDAGEISWKSKLAAIAVYKSKTEYYKAADDQLILDWAKTIEVDRLLPRDVVKLSFALVNIGMKGDLSRSDEDMKHALSNEVKRRIKEWGEWQ